MTSSTTSGLFRKARELLPEVLEGIELGISLRERKVETHAQTEHSAKPDQELQEPEESNDGSAQAVILTPPISGLIPEDPNALASTLDSLASYQEAFTLIEAVALLNLPEGAELANLLEADDRFLVLSPGEDQEVLYLTKVRADRALRSLSIRLALANVSRITAQATSLALRSLWQDGARSSLPSELLRRGGELGVCGRAYGENDIVFPVARVLSHLSRAEVERFARTWHRMARDAYEPDELLADRYEGTLYKLPERARSVLEGRARFVNGPRQTLEAIARTMRVTRERVRQIEFRANEQVAWSAVRAVIEFVVARSGRRVVTGSQQLEQISVLCRAAGIPFAFSPSGEMAVVGMTKEDMKNLVRSSGQVRSADLTDELALLDLRCRPSLIRADLQALCAELPEVDPAVRTKTWHVREILEGLGKPAHYSVVADEYNRLYPEDYTSENAIHALLNREEHGVVWVGSRGAFGLEDLGAFRPLMSYADTVLKIVSEKYGATGRPVPLAVVFAEVGKYRYAPNSESVKMALDRHVDLRRLSGDAYIPLETDDEEQPAEETDVSTDARASDQDDLPETATELAETEPEQSHSDDDIRELSLSQSVVGYIKSLGHEVIDERWRRGAVWVIGGEELSSLFDEPSLRDLRFQFHLGGWSSTDGRPAWRSYNVPS